jgi:hypothetical protein
MLWPAIVTVVFHDTIDTTEMKKTEVTELREYVHRVISEPVEVRLRNTEQTDE